MDVSVEILIFHPAGLLLPYLRTSSICVDSWIYTTGWTSAEIAVSRRVWCILTHGSLQQRRYSSCLPRYSTQILNCWLVGPGKSSPLFNHNSKTLSWYHLFLCFQMTLPWSDQPTSFFRQGLLCYCYERLPLKYSSYEKSGYFI